MTPNYPFDLFYFILLTSATLVHTRAILARRRHRAVVSATKASDRFFVILQALGLGPIPLLYAFTTVLAPLDYRLPLWASALGSMFLTVSVFLLWRAHRDLGEGWSMGVEILTGQHLVKTGLYRRIRHPVYASFWIWALAQPLVLHNSLAGFSMAAGFIPLYFIRVPGEEQLLLNAFGSQYREYMKTTGRVVPRIGRSARPVK